MRGLPFSASIDGLGLSSVRSPAEGESFPADSVVAAGIELLCSLGLSTQLIVSLNAHDKLFLRKFGGPGYRWL